MGGSVSEDLMEQLNLGKHLAWVYSSEDERLHVSIPFVKYALAKRGRCLIVGSTELNDKLKAALEAREVNVSAYIAKDELLFLSPEDIGLGKGSFDPETLLHEIKRQIRLAVNKGWQGLYLTADCSTLLRLIENEDDWIQFEGLLEQQLFNDPVKVLCQYDSHATSGHVLATILKIHPVIGLGNSLGTNPFYADPSSFLIHPLN